MALYLEFEGQLNGPPASQMKRESYVEGVAEELLNGLFCHYEPPPEPPMSNRYPPRSPAGTAATTPTSLQRGILLTPKVITPRPNHGRSVKWIDAADRKGKHNFDDGGANAKTSKVLTGRNELKEAQRMANAARLAAKNASLGRPAPINTTSAPQSKQSFVRPGNRRKNDSKDDKGLRVQTTDVDDRDDAAAKRDPPGMEAEILRNLRKKRDPILSARERKLSMQQRKAQLNLSVLDVNHSDSMSAPQGVLFDDEGYPINEAPSEDSSYYPNRLQKSRPAEKKGLIRFRPPSKSTPGKDPPSEVRAGIPGQEDKPLTEVQPSTANPAAKANLQAMAEARQNALHEAEIARSPSPDAYTSTLCGFGPPTALKSDNGKNSPFSILDGCRPCEAILLEPNEMKDLEDDTVTLAPSEANSVGQVNEPADEIWMAGREERKSRRKWLRRPKNMLNCGADLDQQVEQDSLLTPSRRYLWSRGRSFDSTEIVEVPSWNVMENPSMQSSYVSTDGSRPNSPVRRPTRGRSTRARSPSPASVKPGGSTDDYKTPLQRLRSLRRRLSKSPGRSTSPGRSQSPGRGRSNSPAPLGRSNSPAPQQQRRGRSESPYDRRGRSESPASRRKGPPRSEQDKIRARNKSLFVNTSSTPQSSIFSNLSSNRNHSPAPSQRSDGAYASGNGESSYDDDRDRRKNSHGPSRGSSRQRKGLPPKSPARVTQYGTQRANDEDRDAAEPSKAGLFGRMMRRNNKDARGVNADMSWGADSQSYAQDEYV